MKYSTFFFLNAKLKQLCNDSWRFFSRVVHLGCFVQWVIFPAKGLAAAKDTGKRRENRSASGLAGKYLIVQPSPETHNFFY